MEYESVSAARQHEGVDSNPHNLTSAPNLPLWAGGPIIAVISLGVIGAALRKNFKDKLGDEEKIQRETQKQIQQIKRLNIEETLKSAIIKVLEEYQAECFIDSESGKIHQTKFFTDLLNSADELNEVFETYKEGKSISQNKLQEVMGNPEFALLFISTLFREKNGYPITTESQDILKKLLLEELQEEYSEQIKEKFVQDYEIDSELTRKANEKFQDDILGYGDDSQYNPPFSKERISNIFSLIRNTLMGRFTNQKEDGIDPNLLKPRSDFDINPECLKIVVLKAEYSDRLVNEPQANSTPQFIPAPQTPTERMEVKYQIVSGKDGQKLIKPVIAMTANSVSNITSSFSRNHPDDMDSILENLGKDSSGPGFVVINQQIKCNRFFAEALYTEYMKACANFKAFTELGLFDKTLKLCSTNIFKTGIDQEDTDITDFSPELQQMIKKQFYEIIADSKLREQFIKTLIQEASIDAFSRLAI